MAHATKSFPFPAAEAFPSPPAHARVETPVPESPRKLVRPHLPQHPKQKIAPRRLRGPAPLASHVGDRAAHHGRASAAGQAECFYFQKQIQAQTPMVFVLEDGEQIRGVVEWFDRDTIKVRNTTRTLIFKRSIKYLFKAGGDIGASS